MNNVQKQNPLGYASRIYWPLFIWAGLGVFWLVFQAYVLGRWITGPNFVASNSGSDPITTSMQTYLLWLQILCPVVCVILLWRWIYVPWQCEGYLNSDSMIALAATTIWFWDFSPSIVVDQVLYNSHLFNRGSWGLYAWPGWVSPAGHLLPEPLLFVPPAYVVLVLSQVYFVCWLLKRIKARWVNAGVAAFVVAIILALFVTDSIVEAAFLRTGVYAYPAAIRSLTLFAGETYQFPLTEGFLFGGLALGAMGILKFFKDDRGHTFVERGIDKLNFSARSKQLLRLCAIYGYIHSAFFALYMIPATFVALNGDHYPSGYPSYLLNGMCLYGEDHKQCPGPGISIPRPE